MDEQQPPQQGNETPVEPAAPVEPRPPSDMSLTASPAQRSNKKVWIIAFLVLVLLCGAGLFAYMASENEEDSSAATTSEDQTGGSDDAEDAAASSDFDFAVKDIVYSLMDDGELKREGEFGDRETFLFSSPDESIHYYSKQDSSGNTIAIWKLEGGEDSSVIELERTNKSYGVNGISPDGTKAVLSIFEDTSSQSSTVVLDLIDGTLSTVYEQDSADSPILLPIGWADGNTIVAERLSCLQCDGPRIPEVWSVPLNGEATKLADLTGESGDLDIIESMHVDTQSGNMFAVLTDINPLGGEKEQIDASTSRIYRINLETGESTSIHELEGVYVRIQGVSSDGLNVLIEAREATDSGEGIRYAAPVISQVRVDGSGSSDIALSLSQFDDKSNSIHGMALDVEQKILYVAVNTPAETSGKSSRSVLYSLDISGGENPVNTLYDMFHSGYNHVIELDVR